MGRIIEVESSEVRNTAGERKQEDCSGHSKTLGFTLYYVKSYLRIFSTGCRELAFV